MRLVRGTKEEEARASLMAWADARGIPAREERGWIIIELSSSGSDPVLNVMMEVLREQRRANP